MNTCFQKFWATTRAMALLALGLGPPLEAGAEPGEGAGARGRSGGVLGEGATPRGRVRATERELRGRRAVPLPSRPECLP